MWRIPGLAYDMMHGAVSFTMHEGERMAVSGMSAGMAGGRMIGGGAAVMANAAAGPMGALVSDVQNVGQRLLAGPSGGTGGGSGSGGNTTAAVLNQFRGAGQGSQQGSQKSAGTRSETAPTRSEQTKPQHPDLSFVKDDNTRARLERFSGLGEKH